MNMDEMPDFTAVPPTVPGIYLVRLGGKVTAGEVELDLHHAAEAPEAERWLVTLVGDAEAHLAHHIEAEWCGPLVRAYPKR